MESVGRRIVHFVFDPLQPYTIQRFSRNFAALLDGSYSDLRKTDTEKLEAYCERLTEDPTTDMDINWRELETPSPFEELQLGNMNHLSFAVADSPFSKLEVQKYYPELVAIDSDGNIVARIGPSQKSDPTKKFSSLRYEDGAALRDDKLRINDDRKIMIELEDFNEPGTMLMLVVRSFDTRDAKLPTDEASYFKHAWFRLQNEDTN